MDPRHDDEGWNRGRSGTFHHPETWERFGENAGFVVVLRYCCPTGPTGLPRDQQP